MPRSPGQLPNKLGSDHTHLKSEIIDDVTREAADFGEGGGAIAVTGGGTTVEDVTEIQLLGSAVTDEGGGVAGIAIQTRLLEAEVLFADVVFADGYWTSATTFPVSAGTWVLEVWARIIEDPSGAGATWCGLWWTTSLADAGLLPVAGFGMLDRAAEPAAESGIQVVNTRVTADQSYDSMVGTRQDLQDGAPLMIRPFPALVTENCDLLAALGTDHADGASGWTGSARLYALIAEPA